MAQEWNVNIHYDARLAACVPARSAAVLDVGCGDGFLAARLARHIHHTAPIVWPPRDDIRELRQAAREVLPGARVSRLLFGRYLLTWTRKAAALTVEKSPRQG